MTMFEIVDWINEIMPCFILIFSRMTAMSFTLPIVSYPMISPRIRILLSFVLAILVFSVSGVTHIVFNSLIQLVFAVAREVMIGLIIGFGAKLIFEGFNMAGDIVGRQMGFAIVNVMDPTSHQQMPIISNFWMLVVITFFLVLNGHHMLIGTLVRNFAIIPVGGGNFTPALGRAIIEGGSRTFDIALRFGAPAMIFLLLVDVAIAFIARIMPQMNIFFVTLPLKLGVGIFILMSSMNIFQVLFDSIYDDLTRYMGSIILRLSGA